MGSMTVQNTQASGPCARDLLNPNSVDFDRLSIVPILKSFQSGCPLFIVLIYTPAHIRRVKVIAGRCTTLSALIVKSANGTRKVE